MFTRMGVPVLVFAGITTLGAIGLAQPTGADRAAAEAAFQQAMKLMDEKSYGAACPKLEASHKLDPGVGTLLYLADCYEQLGRTASAWATFRDAAYRAEQEGQKNRETAAKQNAERLETTLSKLTIEVLDPADGMEVQRNGEVVNRALWGSPLPVDPGTHEIVASAPGRNPWSTVITVLKGPHSSTVTVARLAKSEQSLVEPEPARAPPPAVAPMAFDDRSSEQRKLGWIFTGTGGAILTGSGIFALIARKKDQDFEGQCRRDDQNLCSETARGLRSDARTFALLSGVSLGVGAASAMTGLTLLLTAPSKNSARSSQRIRLAMVGGPTGAALRLDGAW